MSPRFSRAWLTIVIIQAMGTFFMCYAKQSKGAHYIGSTPTLARAHALPLALVLVTRIALMFDFRNMTLQITHIVLSAVAVCHTISEVFYFQTMVYGIVSVTEITFNSFTIVILISYLFCLDEDEPAPRVRQFSAKHYMEGTTLTPDENDINVQNYKKRM
ncbi:unnamed protein product [Caenorhabditis angaria]|uniref:Uncharacterized protein n=1 Tax=Caenorhabditis angaria TaxID=860376 RepID=A0A9P1IYH0_9PELO|nr:unnamed protein product [Caenorhabditis angaria]